MNLISMVLAAVSVAIPQPKVAKVSVPVMVKVNLGQIIPTKSIPNPVVVKLGGGK